MKSRRMEFSDRDKADVFVRDRATCCFSGKSLWLLDYGGGPSTADWVDHVVPASKGGSAHPDNGVSASWIFNQSRGTGPAIRLFADGRPSQDWFTLFEVVPRGIVEHFRRFSELHHSDWYFNRAVFHVQHGAALHADQERRGGRRRSRGPDYWSRCALRYLTTWGKLVELERPTLMKSRGLLPTRPSPDQKILIRLTEAEDAAEIGELMLELARWNGPSWDALVALAHAEDATEARAIDREVRAHPFVTVRVKRAVAVNVQRLWGYPKTGVHARKEAKR